MNGKGSGKLQENKPNKKEISEELKEALERCKNAQKQLKRRHQQYCIKKYYEKKEAENK